MAASHAGKFRFQADTFRIRHQTKTHLCIGLALGQQNVDRVACGQFERIEFALAVHRAGNVQYHADFNSPVGEGGLAMSANIHRRLADQAHECGFDRCLQRGIDLAGVLVEGECVDLNQLAELGMAGEVGFQMVVENLAQPGIAGFTFHRLMACSQYGCIKRLVHQRLGAGKLSIINGNAGGGH